jgi:5-oxopent-3-ene-1,2,5-tricarboxylate decarboxylase/2-hydroxyhepta-2,4-diene-1,7-dioate isomerase
MKRARVAFGGAIHDATDVEGGVRLADGRIVGEPDVVWLPPLAPRRTPRTIVALGLNYADHAKELAFKVPEEPLVFLKGPNTLLGHRGRTRRPSDATYMHYECELAVVVGRTARRIARADAYDHVAGYAVANDYAIRDYLENYYRPNLRVKNRDACTPLGPWLVDAADVPDPMHLALRTFVNGRLVQQGTTRDMIFDIPFLLEYLTGFMTLAAGDVILTGTPDGLTDVVPGDEVVTEIDGVGRLVNFIDGDDAFPPPYAERAP